MVVGLLAALLSAAAAANAGATTSTTLPGPAPNQSQINATQSQVSQMETTLAQEEQQTSILDDKYDTAQQDVQNAQTALQAIAANLVHERSSVKADKRHVATDAVAAYVYGTPETGFASYFSKSATQNQERNQYTNQIVGNLTKDETSLLQSETRLAVPGDRAAVRGGTGPVGGRAGQVARAGQRARGCHDEVHPEPGAGSARTGSRGRGHSRGPAGSGGRGSARGTRRRSNKRPLRPRRRPPWRERSAVRPAALPRRPRPTRPAAPPGRSADPHRGSSAGMAAVQAAVSQLGVPYVFGGEEAGVGFDCSGLVQWAWGQAGVTIPRTTETQWPALTHVSLDALQPGDLLFYQNLDDDGGWSTTSSCTPVRGPTGPTR